MSDGKVLLIYLEPTPYLLGLIACLRQRWPAGFDCCFAGSDLSQRWQLPLDAPDLQLLPSDHEQMRSRLRELITSGRYRSLHLAGWGGHVALPMALLLAWWHKLPVTVESDTPLPPHQSWSKRLIKRLAYPLLFRLPSLFMPGGKRQAAMLRYYGVPEHRISIVGMTVDVTAISAHVDVARTNRRAIRARFGIADDAPVLLYVGRMEPHKGIIDMLTAFRQLRAGAVQPVLLLVGEGSLLPALQQEVAGDARIKLAGRLNGTGLLDAYAAADLFVLPSHFEPWGLVVNEAMAAALPVVVTDRVGCVDDLVRDGYNGLVVPAESPTRLKDALQLLIDQPDRVAMMGHASRTVIADWTLEREADNIVAGWNRIGRQ